MSGFKNISMTELSGRIGDAIGLPLHLLPLWLHELEVQQTTVFYCRVGGRSAQAVAFATAQGLKGAANPQGGILAWAQSRGEIVT